MRIREASDQRRRVPTPAWAVVACVAALAALAPGARAEVPYLGVNNAHALRAQDSGIEGPEFYGRLTGMGGNVLRVDVNWATIERTDGQLDTAVLDRELRDAPEGLGVVLMFFNSPQWARDPVAHLTTCLHFSAERCRMPPAPSRLEQWKQMVAATYRHVEGAHANVDVVGVEVWNEPNLKPFWRPHGNEPGRWANLVQATSTAMSEVAPTVPVISGGLGNGRATNVNVGMPQRAYLDAAYAANPSLAGHADGIGVHPYSEQAEPDASSRFAETMREIREVRNARDPGTELWITEVGFHTTPAEEGESGVTPEEQRDWLWRIYRKLDAADDVRAMVIHSLFDATWLPTGVQEREKHFGLVRGEDPKPAWQKFHTELGPTP